MIREPGAFYILNKCNLVGKITIEQANYLFNGGSLCESSTNSNIKKIAEMQSILPLYRLLGGSLKNQVIGGSLLVSRGMLLCQENVERLKLLTKLDIPENLAPAEKFVDQYQYTRGDPEKRKDVDILLLESELIENDKKSTMMIYNGQTLVAGSKFLIQFVLQNVSEIEVGALLQSLYYWQENNSTIGGQASKGHGKLSLSFIDSSLNRSTRILSAEFNFISLPIFIFLYSVSHFFKSFSIRSLLARIYLLNK
jgi:hypothetical protein